MLNPFEIEFTKGFLSSLPIGGTTGPRFSASSELTVTALLFHTRLVHATGAPRHASAGRLRQLAHIGRLAQRPCAGTETDPVG